MKIRKEKEIDSNDSYDCSYYYYYYWLNESNLNFEEFILNIIKEGHQKNIIIITTSINLNKTIQINTKNIEIIIKGLNYPLNENSDNSDNSENSENSDKNKYEIISNGHCIFQISGKNIQIKIENLKLIHNIIKDDKRDIGGALFILGKSNVSINNCEITSTNGFGIWGVQNAICYVDNSSITSIKRSGCVFFGKSHLSLSNSSVINCGQHGVCIRGSVNLTITSCLIRNSGVRGVYAYDKSYVNISHTTISHTISKEHSALDFWGGITIPSNEIGNHNINSNVDLNQSSLIPLREGKCSVEKRFKRSSSPPRTLMVTLDSILFYCNNGSSIRCRENVRCCVSNSFYYSLKDDVCYSFSSFSLPNMNKNELFYGYNDKIKHICWVDEEEQNKQVDQEKERSQKLDIKEFLKNYEISSSCSLSLEKFEEKNNIIIWEYLRNDDEWIRYDEKNESFLSLKYYQFISQSNQYCDGNISIDEEDSASIHLPQPYDRYVIDFKKFQQMNKETFFLRLIRWRLVSNS